MDIEEKKKLQEFATEIRIETIKTIANLGVGHVGGALSICDLLAVLYGKEMRIDPQNPKWEKRDWLVCSKGHAGPAVYSALALKGYFPISELKTLNQPGTNLPSHCDMNRTPGIDMTTGSLGQGSSCAVGIALGHRKNNVDSNTYLILGDGEIQEGQVWEAALFAAQEKLNKLIAFVDNNSLQIDGKTNDVNKVEDVSAKFSAFGWFAQSVDGHDVEAISAAIAKAKNQDESPSMIVLNTIKGKGAYFAENQISSHNTTINEEQMNKTIDNLNKEIEKIRSFS